MAESARRWIFDDGGDLEQLMSFGGICQALSLDCDQVRDRIMLLRPEETEKRSSAGFWLRLR